MGESISDAVFAEFAFDAIARATAPDAIGIAALNHEIFDDAVKGQSIIETLVYQLHEVGTGVRRILVIELDFDIAKVFDRENNHVLYLGSIIQEKRVHVVKERDFF
jgi:hypothetical protein